MNATPNAAYDRLATRFARIATIGQEVGIHEPAVPVVGKRPEMLHELRDFHRSEDTALRTRA